MTYEERQRRLDRARFAIQTELLIGLMVVILTGFHFRPMFYAPPLIQSLLTVALVVSLLAWVWMLRLSRPQPEAGERSWRYRDRAA